MTQGKDSSAKESENVCAHCTNNIHLIAICMSRKGMRAVNEELAGRQERACEQSTKSMRAVPKAIGLTGV